MLLADIVSLAAIGIVAVAIVIQEDWLWVAAKRRVRC